MTPERRSARTDLPTLSVVPMTEQHAEEICRWRYEPPYDVFNWPDWTRMVREGAEFGDPGIRERQYAAVVAGSGADGSNPDGPVLVGYAQFFPITGVTRLGLGLRPDLCGRGLGTALVRTIVEEARRRAPQNAIDLEVLTWNVRAIRAYEKAGFVVADTYVRPTPCGPSEFHCMEYNG
ncbi:GNAT family N-acetyltransferase [Paenibacillus thermoaerophilus]|nr:GNAT family N-acetyltransferase [Paenibacillus thermoaerophilus]